MHRDFLCAIFLGALLLALLAAAQLSATVITVRKDGSGNYTTIGGAIAAAVSGDTILVGPGRYSEANRITIALSLISTDGPDATILDGQSSRQLLYIPAGDGSLVEGFSFVNASETPNEAGTGGSGGAVHVRDGATVTIRECYFVGNSCSYDGAAIHVIWPGSRAVVENCHFEGNFAAHNGGVASVAYDAYLSLTDCEFVQNSSGEHCAGVAAHYSTLNVIQCLFVENSSPNMGGLYYFHSQGTVRNCTFHANSSPGDYGASILVHRSTSTNVTRNIISADNEGHGLLYLEQSPGSHSCNLFYGNADGAIYGGELGYGEVQAPPMFCGPNTGDFSISEESKAAPDNNICGMLYGASPVGCVTSPPSGEAPVITSIDDVGNDQGGQIRIRWTRSSCDDPEAPNCTITGYAVYRREDANRASIGRIDRDDSLERIDGGIALAGWDYIATVPARGDIVYQFVAPTLCDSTRRDGVCWSVFFVSAMTPDPLVYFDSQPDSGYSVDDLPPEKPLGLLATSASAGGVELWWDPSDEEDLWTYRVYRGPAPGFAMSPDNLLGVTTELSMIDPFGDSEVWYKLVAVDDAGNESAAAVAALSTSPGPIPGSVFALYENAPNPFNPFTLIRFDVPDGGGHVTIRIFDVSGKLVRTLVDGFRPSGAQSFDWDATDANGARVSSGVYFLRMNAEGYARTIKMTLVE